MSTSPLTIGHDREGAPIVIPHGRFAVVISVFGTISTYGALEAVVGLFDGQSSWNALAELVAQKVAAELERLRTKAEAATALGLTTMNEPPILIGYPEAAHLLGVTVEALAQRVSRGQIPRKCIVRTGVRVQFVRSKLGEMKSAPSRRTA